MTTGIFTGIIFLWFIIAGISFAIIYELGYILRAITKFNTIVTIIVDTIVFLFAGVLFFICMYKLNNGIITYYEILAFMIGFSLERLSLGKSLAKILVLVYNKFTQAIRWLKQKSKFFKFLLR